MWLVVLVSADGDWRSTFIDERRSLAVWQETVATGIAASCTLSGPISHVPSTHHSFIHSFIHNNNHCQLLLHPLSNLTLFFHVSWRWRHYSSTPYFPDFRDLDHKFESGSKNQWRLIDWVKVLRPTQNKIGHLGDIHSATVNNIANIYNNIQCHLPVRDSQLPITIICIAYKLCTNDCFISNRYYVSL